MVNSSPSSVRGDLLKAKLELYKRQKNCEKLIVPQLNDGVQNTLSNIQIKSDMRMGYIQQAFTTATTAICLMTDTLLKQKSDEKLDIKQLIKKGTDAIALLGHANNRYRAL